MIPQYDKIIVDTSNIFYRIASMHLKNLTQEIATQLIKSNDLFRAYKSAIINLKTVNTEICLLFDPLLSNKGDSSRVKIKEEYKANREKNNFIQQIRIDTLTKLYSSFLIEPIQGISVYHDVEFEADDFVEKLTETGKCLLMTSDEDFARYLEQDRVEMLKKGFTLKPNSIFTANDFEKKHKFKPTISSVTFWKAMYGDKSDNIVGSFQNDSTKVLITASNEMKRIIKLLGENNVQLARAKADLFAGSGEFVKFKELLQLSNTERSYEKILDLTDTNFQLIESRLPRESSTDINNYKIKLEFNNLKPAKKKFSLSGLKG